MECDGTGGCYCHHCKQVRVDERAKIVEFLLGYKPISWRHIANVWKMAADDISTAQYQDPGLD